MDELSASELRDLVVRAVRGSHNWASPAGPHPTRELEFYAPDDVVEDLFWFVEPLPGGRYAILSTYRGLLQCWDLTSDDFLGEYLIPGEDRPAPLGPATVDLQHEVVEGGSAVNVLVIAFPEIGTPSWPFRAIS